MSNCLAGSGTKSSTPMMTGRRPGQRDAIRRATHRGATGASYDGARHRTTTRVRLNHDAPASCYRFSGEVRSGCISSSCSILKTSSSSNNSDGLMIDVAGVAPVKPRPM